MLPSLRSYLLPTSSCSLSFSRAIGYKEGPRRPRKMETKLQGNKQYQGRTHFDDVYDMKINLQGMRFFNKRHKRSHKKLLFKSFEYRDPKYDHMHQFEHKYGTRSTGIRHNAYWEHVPEMVPELVVPDLTDCSFKPYVSYRTMDIVQEELTSRELFNLAYGSKILKDYEKGKLNEDGQPLEPSENESMTSEEAWAKARQTGSDIFEGGIEPSKEWKTRYDRR